MRILFLLILTFIEIGPVPISPVVLIWGRGLSINVQR
jgi:hypothetical protein